MGIIDMPLTMFEWLELGRLMEQIEKIARRGARTPELDNLCKKLDKIRRSGRWDRGAVWTIRCKLAAIKIKYGIKE